jgi:D-3-phosphoglycerate dehydrogenase / 2-oxoglutarate reductase
MTKVLVATIKPFASEAVTQIREIIESAGYELALLEKYSDQSEFVDAVADADAMIIRSDNVDSQVIEAASKLKIVVRAGAGYDNVDLAAASAKKIVVMNTPGQNSGAVAELAIGMMLYLSRNCFAGTSGAEIAGKTLGLHAYGYVGKKVAQMASGFGMEIYAYDPFIDKAEIENDGVKCLNSAEELYRTCQYISLHIPANDKTRGSINYDLLSLMPDGAMLVNTARKEVIDEASLARVFKERQDFRYASDVAPDNSGELNDSYAGRLYCTPKKMGAQTAEANVNAGKAAARQIIAFLEQGDTTFQVNE